MSVPTPPPGYIVVHDKGREGAEVRMPLGIVFRANRYGGSDVFMPSFASPACSGDSWVVTESPAELDALIADAQRREWEAREEARLDVRFDRGLAGATRFYTGYDPATDSVDDALGGEQV